jgi:hypothetical protein
MVSLPRTNCLDVVDGILRLDLWCDERGRRTLERVQPGVAAVHATWLGRRAMTEVLLLDEQTTRVTLVVP